MPPNSSTTIAICVRAWRICTSRSRIGIDGATNSTLRSSRSSSAGRRSATGAEHVLDVDKADHVIERLAIHRHARMAVLDHAFDDFGERLIDVERDDVDARHHDVGGIEVMHLQDVADQQPLLRRDRGLAVELGGRDQRVHRPSLAAPAAGRRSRRNSVRSRASDLPVPRAGGVQAGRRLPAARGRSSKIKMVRVYLLT